MLPKRYQSFRAFRKAFDHSSQQERSRGGTPAEICMGLPYIHTATHLPPGRKYRSGPVSENRSFSLGDRAGGEQAQPELDAAARGLGRRREGVGQPRAVREQQLRADDIDARHLVTFFLCSVRAT